MERIRRQFGRGGCRTFYGLLCRLWAASVLWLSVCVGVASAEAEAESATVSGDRPTVAVVVESDAGLALARRVRTLMQQHLRFDVRPLSEFMDGGARPDAVVSVTVAASSAGDVNVVYWDRAGTADALVGPRPGATSALGWVAASMAVGLVRRHVEELEHALLMDPGFYGGWPGAPTSRGKAAPLSTLSPSAVRRFLNQMGVVAHRTEGLSEADF